jgi:deazaflavin-dependent oxidoreductase (nitroreductase family)
MRGLGVVVHRGRRSGRVYQTPVNVFAARDGYVRALTYGPDTDWVKNVLEAGGCELRTRGRIIQVTAPRLYHDEARHGIRPLERQVLRAIHVADFLSLTTASAAAPASGQPLTDAGATPPDTHRAGWRVISIRSRYSRRALASGRRLNWLAITKPRKTLLTTTVRPC